MTSDKFEDHSGKQYNVKTTLIASPQTLSMRSFARSARNMSMSGRTGDTLYQCQLWNLSRIKTKYGDPVAINFYTDGHTLQDISVMSLKNLQKTQ